MGERAVEGLKFLRGSPEDWLRLQLLLLRPCSEAITWLEGQALTAETWNRAPAKWRDWLRERLCLEESATYDSAIEALANHDGYGVGGYGSYGDGSGYGSYGVLRG